jgi:hypothetical protein
MEATYATESMPVGQFLLSEGDYVMFLSAFLHPCLGKGKAAIGYYPETVELNCYYRQASILWTEDVKMKRICFIIG